ncbi:variant SH3 domain-containing protein [Tahibacter aquaticus]|uniref:Variant SH3 domain-containing protein n=1 Tax=Tahibacter aquaticus TaxID=520092 RepID=A0A4V3DNK9_9GAMM|nr:SH3 domain-containing protein [Tahibacter aquaticus]TDR48846.1 variant SH3 domain-containing protein [Tahibacter aquaticus]
MMARLLRDYRRTYADPVRFASGERVTLGARDGEWPQFIWATDAGGRSGWVHERYLDTTTGTTASAVRDYSALELDANAGERVRLIEEAGGWYWVENECGAQGWLPARDLSMEQERGDA